MRLRDTQRIIDAANLPVRPHYSREASSGENHPLGVAIHNCIALKQSLTTLAQAPAFAAAVKPILSSKAFSSQYGDIVYGPRSELDPVVSQLNNLINAVAFFRNALNAALPDESTTTLAVQIPTPGPLENLEALVGDLRRFFDILSKIDDANGGERVEMRPTLQAFDSGSFYLELMFSTVAALSIVGVVTRAAYNALAIWENYKQAQARISLTGLAVRELESITTHNESLRAAIMEGAVNELKSRFPKVKGEGEAALRAALKQKTEMLEKHIIFLPPATAPNEIFASFPTPKEIMHVLSGDPMKLIGASSQEKDAPQAPAVKTTGE